jgi:hypothetical protein
MKEAMWISLNQLQQGWQTTGTGSKFSIDHDFG